jgi:hypothetical protein
VAFPIDAGIGRPEELLRDGSTLYVGGDKFTMPNGPAQRFSNFSGTGAVGGGFFYGDGRIDLTNGSVVTESTHSGYGNGPANSCGVFGERAGGPNNIGDGLFFMPVTGWVQTAFSNPAGVVTAPLIHQTQGVASTSPARVVIAGNFIYWTDSYAGAIYKLAPPQ